MDSVSSSESSDAVHCPAVRTVSDTNRHTHTKEGQRERERFDRDGQYFLMQLSTTESSFMRHDISAYY